MDIKTNNPAGEAIDSGRVLSNLRDLYERNLYRQAYDLGRNALGELADWRDPALRLIGARTLSQLGGVRWADAQILKLWRSGWRDPDFLSFYLLTTHRRRGPLATLAEIQSIRQSSLPSEDFERDLLLEEASVYASYRDFGTAETCLRAASALHRDRWSELQVIDLKTAEDKYEDALALAEALNREFPDYRSGIQKQAHLLQLLGRDEDAITLLETYFPRFESWWMGTQLFSLLVEQKVFDRAASCLQQLEALPPAGSGETETLLKRMKSDLLCSQGQYQDAVPYLLQKNFFSDRIRESIEQSGPGSARTILEVPFVRQANMTCAPASLTAVSRYWGRDIDQAEVVEAICYGGTQNYDERRWALDNDWYAVEFDLNFPALKALIDVDVPVLLATVEPGSAHLQIIVGYDESMGTYLLRDPYYPRLQEFLIGETEKHYAANGPRCLVVAPQSCKSRIEATPLTNRRLYDALYKLNMALKNNDRKTAQQIVQALGKHSPKERLSLICERSLAIYDGDEDRILSTTEKLLNLYPDEVNFQLSKLASLNELGAGTEALSYLRDITRQPNSHFLLLSRLARAISWDHRLADETDRLYKHLLKRSPLHVPTLYGYAGTLWDKQEYQRAYQLYRFCTCLEDTNEAYVESFFKAARYNRETDTAIEFLVDRFHRFAAKSSGPTISLFNALDSINRTEAAFDYLEQGLRALPGDGYLKLFAARQYTYQGKVARGLELLETARGIARDIEISRTAIDLYEATLEPDKAQQACLEILAAEPLNTYANSTYARLLVAQNRRSEALQFIRSQLDRFNNNLMLQNLLVRWLDPEDIAARVAVYEEVCRNHPMDAAAFRSLSEALIELGQYPRAVELAKTAVDINRRDAANYGYLGDAFLAINDRQSARETFREAVRVSCDYSYAYERLMLCSHDIETQKQDLDFIHGELMKQVSYGAGILEFQQLGSRYLSADKLHTFLDFALQKRPDLWHSWVAMMIHLRNDNRLEEALDVANRALGSFPMLPRLYLEKAEIQRVMHNVEGAIETLKKALEISPGWTAASNALCDLYEKTGDYDAAIALQELAARHSPLAPSPLGYLADLYHHQGRIDEAIDALQRAVTRDSGYVWAWEKLSSLEAERGNAGSVLAQMRDAIDRSPRNPNLLEAYVDLAGRDDKAIGMLQSYLADFPNDVDICIKLINCYVNRGDFDRAKELVSEAYWNNARPLSIVSNEAWIYAREENLSRAVAIMEAVAEQQPNYYDAWRFLAVWNTQLRDQRKLEQAVDNCARIHPHNPAVLCFCAEKLKEAGSTSPRVMAFLKHAFELDPTDQYNALTYIDELIEAGDMGEADLVCQRTLQFNENAYVYLRAVQIALADEDTDKALQYFDRSLDDVGQNTGIVYLIWKDFVRAQLQREAAEVITRALACDRKLHPDAGKCMGFFEFGNLGMRKFEKQLLTKTFNTGFDQRYLEAYLRKLIDHQQLMSWNLGERLWPFLKQDVINWGLYGYGLFNINGREAQAVKVWEGIEDTPGVEAWIVYFASMANRWAGDWSRGVALTQRAFDLPNDRYHDDILLWLYFDHLIAGGELDPALLTHLDHSDLEPMSKYVVLAARALADAQTRNFVDDYETFSPLLRQCQGRYQRLVGNPVILKVKKRLEKHLRDGLPRMSLLKAMWWRWRLSNHF